MEIILIPFNVLTSPQTGHISCFYLCILSTLDSAQNKPSLVSSRTEEYINVFVLILYLSCRWLEILITVTGTYFYFAVIMLLVCKLLVSCFYFIFSARYYTQKIKSLILKFMLA